MASASSLASVLLRLLTTQFREKMTQGDFEEGLAIEAMRNQGDLEQGTEKLAEVVQQEEENWGHKSQRMKVRVWRRTKWIRLKERAGRVILRGQPRPAQNQGLFPKIDLGLQDNEILPPLKGYKAYNQQLAHATTKLKWQEERTKNPPQLDRNFMDGFDFVEEEEEEILTGKEEEARARAEQEEVRQQEAEAQEAREEEQRLADIASDMLLEYMGRKQKASSYMRDMKSAALLNNVPRTNAQTRWRITTTMMRWILRPSTSW